MEDPYNQMNNTGNLRRKYPKDKQGAKSEWLGVEQHMAEINDDLRKNEQEIVSMRKKELLTELDRKILEQLQQKQENLELKQFEMQEMLRRQQIYEEENRRYQQDRQSLNKAMQNVYDKQKQDQIMKDLEERERKLEWERMALDENRKRMESEAMKRRLQKEMWARDQENDLRLSEARMNDQKQKQYMDQLEIQELNRRNAEREIIKEENYRNFYRMCAENQASLQKQHIDNVMQPLIEKQRQLESMIAKNMDQYQRKLLQDELDRVMKRQQDYQVTLTANKQMIAEKDNLKEYEKIEKQDRNKQRLQDLNNYNQYLLYKKQEGVDRQREYKEFLDQQRREKYSQFFQLFLLKREEQKLRQQRMGRLEKNMNRLDLQSYKSADTQLHSMIPGWSPQVGQLPPKLDRLARANNSLVQVKQNEQDMIQKNQSSIQNQDYKAVRGDTFKITGQQSINTPSQQQQGGYNVSHNPITNPMPFNNQNPYVRKQQEQIAVGRYY